jgi:hypothetical protein
MNKQQLVHTLREHVIDELINDYDNVANMNDVDGIVENIMADIDNRINEFIETIERN